MARFMCIVAVPAVFYVEAEDENAALAMAQDDLEDAAFDQLGKYVELDLRTATFDDVTIYPAEDDEGADGVVQMKP